MSELEPGLYERLVTEELRAALAALPHQDLVRQDPLHQADAADRIAWHVGRQIERALLDVSDEERVAVGVRVARELLDRLGELAASDPTAKPAEPGDILHAILRRQPDGKPAPLESPLIPLLDTTLLTNARGEPTLWSQLLSEIESADQIDVVMAFIRRSGIRPLLPSLARHCAAGKQIRVLTTTYTDSTEQAALDLLTELGAQVRVSYDIGTTRLHAKAWVFHRNAGYSTAYVGSSNLTHSASVTGIEWNVRASAARNPDVIAKFQAVFETYWSGGEFVPYDPDEFATQRRRAGRADDGPAIFLSPIEVQPHPFQARLLELLELSRRKGHHRNLLVAATGTGKTVMAAIDFADLQRALPRSRLLFIAHREEILDQSLATFRHVLRDASFGEKWVGGARPSAFEHVFASIQSLHTTGLAALPADHFDVVIVDEFHHAAAPTYDKVLNHLSPRELLGLTATPERSDGQSILEWFDNRIAAELRLWDAIDQQHLAPFLYYGIHDQLDLSDIPWRRGRGYDAEALSTLYTSNDAWARLVIKQLDDHVDVATMRALGFCVSIDHAHFMAAHFVRAGIPAVAVSGLSSWTERRDALRDLKAGRVRVVLSVDLFNEGVDVPDVDTILLLRPTDSPTLFLQQLGRGLRKMRDKPHCTVLDFVGHHRKEFRFDRRFRALLGGTRSELERAVRQGFPFLPAGCHLSLDPVARDIVLRNIQSAIPSKWPAKVEELRALQRSGNAVTLASFLEGSGLDLEDLYSGSKSWSDLCEDAGLAVLASGPHETSLRRAIGRLLHVDDDERLATYRRWLGRAEAPRLASLPTREQRLLHMLVASMTDQVITAKVGVQEAVDLLWAHPQVCPELGELFGILEQRIDHLHAGLASHPDAPLQVHARYTRLEILAALGVHATAKIPSWQSGVYDAKAANADLLAFTLDKTTGGFSPTTRYRDYAISRTLIHWESQSMTRADSTTGQRYQRHAEMDRSILLFTRLRNDDRAFWFLGPATYRSHVGERPMAITWELATPLPGDLFQTFAAAVA